MGRLLAAAAAASSLLLKVEGTARFFAGFRDVGSDAGVVVDKGIDVVDAISSIIVILLVVSSLEEEVLYRCSLPSLQSMIISARLARASRPLLLLQRLLGIGVLDSDADIIILNTMKGVRKTFEMC